MSIFAEFGPRSSPPEDEEWECGLCLNTRAETPNQSVFHVCGNKNNGRECKVRVHMACAISNAMRGKGICTTCRKPYTDLEEIRREHNFVKAPIAYDVPEERREQMTLDWRLRCILEYVRGMSSRLTQLESAKTTLEGRYRAENSGLAKVTRELSGLEASLKKYKTSDRVFDIYNIREKIKEAEKVFKKHNETMESIQSELASNAVNIENTKWNFERDVPLDDLHLYEEIEDLMNRHNMSSRH